MVYIYHVVSSNADFVLPNSVNCVYSPHHCFSHNIRRCTQLFQKIFIILDFFLCPFAKSHSICKIFAMQLLVKFQVVRVIFVFLF
jgi:hypothetical protein